MDYFDGLEIAVIKCPSLPHPTFGHVKLNGSTPGYSAYYSCTRGYYLVGYAYRKCLGTGLWDGKVPACKCESRERNKLTSCLTWFAFVISDQVWNFGCSQAWLCECGWICVGLNCYLQLCTRIQAEGNCDSQVLLWQVLDWKCSHLCL